MTVEADVVVVGAGFAGLAAARSLRRSGLRAVVVEARDRVGGRVLNQPIGDGVIVEAGGQWLGPGQDRMYALAKEYSISTYPTYDTGKTVALLGGKRHEFAGDLPRLNPLVIGDFVQGFYRLERLAKTISLETPWQHVRSAWLDSWTLEDWLQKKVKTKRARELIALFVGGVFACEPADLSLFWFLYYLKSGHSFDRLIRTTGGAQQDRLTGGTQLLAEAMSRELGDDLMLGRAVLRIERGDESVTASGEGFSVRAARAIVTIPPATVSRIVFSPQLPAEKLALFGSMPHGRVIKVSCVYPSPFWRADGLSGQAGAPDLMVSFTFDNTPPEGVPGVLTGFIEGDSAVKAASLSSDERRRRVEDCLVSYFGENARRPDAYFELDWTSQEWTRGCYGARMPPGVMTSLGKHLRTPTGSIHWAGTETARRWVGYMEGAVESGERAADEVLVKVKSPGAGR